MTEGNQTKAMIGQALLLLCQEQEFTKISVQEIAQKAQVNRQTFYYHFSDKIALVHWIYYTDSLIYLTLKEVSLDNWEEAALNMLKAMKEQHSFYYTTMKSNRDLLIGDFYQIVQPLFCQLFHKIDTDQILSEQDLQFYSRFFSYGCGGILENWIRTNFEEEPIEIAAQLYRLAKDLEFYAYRIYQDERYEGEIKE